VEGSKRSSHSNAYFYGFYKSKKIVLFDTLLADSPIKKEVKDDEVEKESTEDDSKSDNADNSTVVSINNRGVCIHIIISKTRLLCCNRTKPGRSSLVLLCLKLFCNATYSGF
jgi:hypothetical protein